MMIIRECNICTIDYMYDPNMQPQYRDICQDCYEQRKKDEKLSK